MKKNITGHPSRCRALSRFAILVAGLVACADARHATPKAARCGQACPATRSRFSSTARPPRPSGTTARTTSWATPGERYVMRVHNHSGRRIEAVVTVDGRDVSTASPATFAAQARLPGAGLGPGGHRRLAALAIAGRGLPLLVGGGLLRRAHGQRTRGRRHRRGGLPRARLSPATPARAPALLLRRLPRRRARLPRRRRRARASAAPRRRRQRPRRRTPWPRAASAAWLRRGQGQGRRRGLGATTRPRAASGPGLGTEFGEAVCLAHPGGRVRARQRVRARRSSWACATTTTTAWWPWA